MRAVITLVFEETWAHCVRLTADVWFTLSQQWLQTQTASEITYKHAIQYAKTVCEFFYCVRNLNMHPIVREVHTISSKYYSMQALDTTPA